MTLFVRKDIVLHSGLASDFKIEAESLTDEDIATIAYLISKRHKFKKVIGVPTGGERLAKALEQYEDSLSAYTLLVDDVLTTGGSMIEYREKLEGYVTGVVIFARGKCPLWIDPVFQMWDI